MNRHPGFVLKGILQNTFKKNGKLIVHICGFFANMYNKY